MPSSTVFQLFGHRCVVLQTLKPFALLASGLEQYPRLFLLVGEEQGQTQEKTVLWLAKVFFVPHAENADRFLVPTAIEQKAREHEVNLHGRLGRMRPQARGQQIDGLPKRLFGGRLPPLSPCAKLRVGDPSRRLVLEFREHEPALLERSRPVEATHHLRLEREALASLSGVRDCRESLPRASGIRTFSEGRGDGVDQIFLGEARETVRHQRPVLRRAWSIRRLRPRGFRGAAAATAWHVVVAWCHLSSRHSIRRGRLPLRCVGARRVAFAEIVEHLGHNALQIDARIAHKLAPPLAVQRCARNNCGVLAEALATNLHDGAPDITLDLLVGATPHEKVDCPLDAAGSGASTATRGAHHLLEATLDGLLVSRDGVSGWWKLCNRWAFRQ
mmetsp:Transcript_86368/g.241551  ORF Transcript_86368/g.241551 Transcript_86368/m.241551 type:complete len:387 (+) Transcript_86368:1139-2299(+)